MKTRMLIGIRGSFQAGKDTLGDLIIEELKDRCIPAAKKSFAFNLKQATALVFGIDPDYVMTEEFKKGDTHVNRLDTPGQPGDEKMTGRQLLQFFGSEICRSMDYNCWARGPVTYFKQNDRDHHP